MSEFFTKPALADDADLSKVLFPCWHLPKIDGVRAMNLNGTLTGRSLDPFKGFGITERFSGEKFLGLDGEMTLGVDTTMERLCSLTTGAMSKFKGATEMADLHWWIFDLVRPSTVGMPYEQRYRAAKIIVDTLEDPRVRMVPFEVIESAEDLDFQIGRALAAGYEGSIIRNPAAPFKPGRPSLAHWEFMRVKPFGDAEILVTGLTEGNRNENEAKTNTLGQTERSTAKDGLVPNGQVGSIQGTLLADVHCPFTKKFLFPQGMPVTVSPGKMTTKEATDFWENPQKIVGHIVKFQHMTYGVKDLPRFATFQSLRLPQDMS